MTVLMRLIALVLIVAALMLLGADAVTSLEKGGEITVRSLDLVWSLIDPGSLAAFKDWAQHSRRSWRRRSIPPWRCRAGG